MIQVDEGTVGSQANVGKQWSKNSLSPEDMYNPLLDSRATARLSELSQDTQDSLSSPTGRALGGGHGSIWRF